MVIMNLNILNGKKHIHFIGIGGSGMYPLAQILHSWAIISPARTTMKPRPWRQCGAWGFR